MPSPYEMVYTGIERTEALCWTVETYGDLEAEVNHLQVGPYHLFLEHSRDDQWYFTLSADPRFLGSHPLSEGIFHAPSLTFAQEELLNLALSLLTEAFISAQADIKERLNA